MGVMLLLFTLAILASNLELVVKAASNLLRDVHSLWESIYIELTF